MAVHLLDVNVLIALVWANHAHHGVAHAWFAQHAVQGWATCPMTQCGFVRISSNPRAIAEAVSPGVAAELLRRLAAHPNHVFWPDDVAWTVTDDVKSDLIVGRILGCTGASAWRTSGDV
jgi:toxin-antitoxin system PIN domain toxin